MYENEKIISVALIYNSLIFSLPPPARHGTLLHHFHTMGVDKNIFPNQGFLTNKGRYVTREEARDIVIANQQCIPQHSTQLFSEDLF